MEAPTRRTARASTTVNLRIPKATRELIDTAATILGKTRTEFVLETARRQAVDVVLDQRFFTLDGAAHEAFMRVLDNPPPPNAALRRLMSSKAPWER